MSKQGMKRPEYTHTSSKNDVPPVPEIQGKAKHGKAKVNPIIAGTESPSLKVYHAVPHATDKVEKPISEVYPVIDNDLARDNVENDMTFADLCDMDNMHR